MSTNPKSSVEVVMSNLESEPRRYPLLESLLEQKHLPMKGIFTYRDLAKLLDAGVRTIQVWCKDGKIVVRDLPARGRFLAQDVEDFLERSVRKHVGP
jgi:NADPH-dependent curcumin reductase CurA